MTRAFRGDDRGSAQGRAGDFDPIAEGEKYALAPAVSLAVWNRARREATDARGECDEMRARERFHEFAARIAARGGRLVPDIGALTRVGAEAPHGARGGPRSREFGPRAPGRTTLVLAEAKRWGAADRAASDLDERAAQEAHSQGARQAYETESSPTPQHAPSAEEPAAPRPLDAALGHRLGALFGFDFARTRVVPDSPEATGATKAVTKDGQVHFRAGEYRPDTTGGSWLIAHELVHVVQQDGARGERAGTRQELEREADRAATLAVAGRAAPISLRGDRAAAYAFNEGEDHAHGQPPPEKAAGAHAKAAHAQPDAAEVHAPQGKAEHTTGPGAPAPGGKPAAPQAQGAEASDADAGEAKAQGAAEVHAHAAAGGGHGAPAGRADAGANSEMAPASADRPGADTDHRGAAGGALGSGDPGEMLASLGEARPSGAASALAQLQGAAPAAFEAARAAAQGEVPSVPAPTGLPAKAERPKLGEPGAAEASPEDPHRPKSGGPTKKVADTLVREAPGALPLAPTELPGADAQAHGTERASAHDEALATGARQALSSVRLPAAQISTKATGTPSVDLGGKADPAQVPQTHQIGGEQIKAASREAAKAISQPRGEHNISPAATPETLSATLPAPGARVPIAAAAPGPAALEPEALASIDAEAAGALHAKIAPERDKYAQGKTAHDAEMKAAHAKHRTDVAATEADARARQEGARTKAREEVGGARADWQHEVDKVGTDFRTKAEAAKTEHRGRMENEQRSANRQAAAHLRNAERAADAEKRRAEDEAAAKKAEAGKESKGFWGWVKSKAKALIDGIKAAVNFIYDRLRSAVKAIFDAAKRLALGVIELARKAIVGLITAFGAVLKGFVKIALAAFPKLRDRMLRRIDQAVQRAEQAVNAVAGALTKAVAALIDFLASTIDKVLGLIQDLYNAALTVIGMLVTGELQELLRKVGQLIAAAKTAPGRFETAAYEELLGGNLDEPLSPAALKAAGRVAPGGTPGATGASEPTAPQEGEPAAAEGGPAPEEDGGDASEPAPGPPWTRENVGVDEVSHGEELSPELEEEVQSRPGNEIEFGESADQGRSLDAMLGGRQGAGAVAHEGAADAVAVAPSDGLTPRQRAEVKWGLMKKGLADWWSKNWPMVLAGGVLAVAGFIVANILTGGAILAALPVIMTAIGYLFAGVMVVQLAGHLRDFLAKGWAGDIRGGGKSLAKGLAAAVIELLTWLTFKVGGVALKAGKAAAKGVAKGAQAVGRGVAAAGKGIARVAKAGAQYIIRAGKVLLAGVGRGIGRAAKRLRDLGERLLARTRFKGFRIRLQGRRFFLEGKINPWVLLADGTLKWEKPKGAGDAFKIAQAGGKHAGFLRNYAGRSAGEIQRGIASIEKQIAEHQGKIANPMKFLDNWSKLDPRQQQALVNSKWPSDIQRQSEQLEILRGLLGGG
jgi:Domain of unknown function (DUF4157)